MKAGLPLILLMTGCGYLSARAKDFGDCWRAEVIESKVPGVWIHAGPVTHVGFAGVDDKDQFSAGHRYNYPKEKYLGSAILPGEVYFLMMHSNSNGASHTCSPFLSGILQYFEGYDPLLHRFDLEVAVIPFGGFVLGFSTGEFLDLLLGLFGIDIAGDDHEGADAERSYARDRADRAR